MKFKLYCLQHLQKKYKVVLLTFCLATIFTACQKDIFTQKVLLPPSTSTVVNCKECVYYPTCVNLKYEYIDTLFGKVFNGGDTVYNRNTIIVSTIDSVINGKTYQKIGSSIGNGVQISFVNCTNGETSMIIYNTQYSATSIELKANAPISSTWADSVVYNTGDVLYKTHTIMETGISRNLLGVTYNDVIRVRVNQTLKDHTYLTIIPYGTKDFYSAKGIGLIEIISYEKNGYGNDVLKSHSVLKSFFLP